MADQSPKRSQSTDHDQSTERDANHEEDAGQPLNRSYEALFYNLAELREGDGDAPFRDNSFSLMPDEFWDFHESHKAGEFACKIGNYEYDGTTLYFKNMTLVHDSVGGTLQTEIDHQLLPLQQHPQVGNLVSQLQSRAGWPVYASDKSFSKPDFAFGKRGFLLPTLVGEVSYSRHFSREQLEAKYKAYLTESKRKIRTVICVDLHYAGTGEKFLKTARDLDRTTISMWTIQDGIVITVVDWVPLS
ncbi:hypothetical protein B0H67DRAFT_135103 [Lasiosphaeris hirsuta]|uniref:Uncharacterized protein n=1 Tax=Lasiosphaeris hirsuta TaxID=260670 RepID=A0AA40B0W0_9PEZI|nr:hypothetical protein B0H67DRAFT_135103 [Lasiosphaeris hirsuta]